MYRILLIDDEETIVEGLKKLVPWSEIDCDIIGVAVDGQDGLHQCRQLKPDIVISDIRMPKLSGLEMIRQIKALKKDVKFVLLTGFREFEYAREAVNLGVVKFLLKPTNIEDIKSAVLEAINQMDEEREKVKDIEVLRKKLHKYNMINHEEIPPEEKGHREDKNKYLTGQAIQFIKDQHHHKLDLQTVADHLYISSWYLCKILRKEVGSSFVELLNEVRIQHAKKLLINTHDKIYEITEKVGYVDTPYFSRTFKKHVGLTPKQYRDQNWQH